MNNYKVYEDKLTHDKIYYEKLESGLDVYIYKKTGFVKKMGLYGTRYGSVDNEFIDNTGNRVKVPDGIAHFLEHKLFEKEGENALDIFSKMGISCNAYTSNDHTVYYFETSEKFEIALKTLVTLIKEPYFTDENVEKEKGIISQEIKMYDDNPDFVVYMNLMKALYKENEVNIDIAGTVESIMKIDKDILYNCYNTFYNNKNMFLIVVGDVEIEPTMELIKKETKKYDREDTTASEITRFYKKEPIEVNVKEIEKNLDIFLPKMYLGYKMQEVTGVESKKNDLISSFIDEIYFGRFSKFYEEMYNNSYINSPCSFTYESTATFAYLILACSSTNTTKMQEILLDYINKIKNEEVDEELFNIVKRKKIGEMIFGTESVNNAWRNIIEDDMSKNEMFSTYTVLDSITKEDIKNFIKNNMTEEEMSISKILCK